MAATVDERIVAAKFDASDFEKGVDKTIKKLDELKKSLSFKEATKSVKELAEKTEVSTNSMSNSLEKLTDRFTSFTGMIKQKILSGLADEFANVFLRMEQSVKNFISSISTQQIGAGLDKYQQMLTAVRVMVSNGVSENDAYNAMADLREYTDQTSYSITQMTDALSKMVSAGLEGGNGLEIATKAVQGIANACANAGINAQDAGRAFYNLAQAYSKGKLEYNDYRSLELLNMTTREFKQELMEAAVEVGTLEKVSEGVYKITNKVKSKGGKGKKVTEKNLTDMLRYDFATNAVMNKFFGKYYFSEKEMDKIYDEILPEGTTKFTATEEQRAKALEKAKEQYGELAVKAYMAAREARSFTDVVNTLKDAVSSGWAQSFEYLFGKLETAKNFFTELTEGPLAECIYLIGTYRNRLLGVWDGVDGRGGGKIFRDTIINITKALGNLLYTFLQILPGFSEVESDTDEANSKFQELGHSLIHTSQKIGMFAINLRNATQRFNEFMNEKAFSDGTTRIEMIRRVFANLSSVISIAGRVIGIALKGISDAFYTLSPLFDGVLVILSKITQPLTDLKNDPKLFNDIQYSIENILNVLNPVAKVLGEVLGFIGEIAGFIASITLSSFVEPISFFSDFLALLMEVFGQKSAQMEHGVGILDGMRQEFEGIKKACQEGLGAVKGFFDALLGDIKALLGLNKEVGSSDAKTGGIFAGLTNFFKTNQFVKDAKAWVNQAIIDVGDFIKSIPSRVKTFGANIYTTLYNLFFAKKTVKETDENGKTIFKSVEVLTPLGEWLDGVIKDVKAFILDIPNKVIAGVGKIGNWIDDIFNAIFGDGSNKNKNEKNTVKTAEEKAQQEKESKFQEFLDGIIKSVKEWFADLPNKVRKGLKSVGNFFSRLLGVIDEFLFGKKNTQTIKNVDEKGKVVDKKVITTRVKTGFSKWLDGIIVEVKKFIDNIPTYIKEGIKGAGDLVSMIINAIFGRDSKDKTPTSQDVQEELEKPFLGINISNIINTLKEIGLEIFNQIARIFTGSDKLEENQEWFSTAIANGIRWIRTKAETAFEWVLKFISSLPQTIANIFSGEDANNPTSGTVGNEITKFGQAVGSFIAGLPASIAEFFNSAINEFNKWWQKLYDSITGKSEESSKYAENELGYPTSFAHNQAQTKSSWDSFVENLGKLIASAFENLPKWIAQGIDLAVIGINKLISGIGEWFKNEDIEKEAKKAVEVITKGTDQLTTGAQDAANDVSSEENPLWTAIKNLGLHIYTLITETIPTMISEAWKWIGTKATEIWEGIESIFSGEIPEEKTGEATDTVAGKIKTFIQNELPTKISNIWKDIGKLAEDIWDGVSSLFSGEIPESERGRAIRNVILAIKNFITKDLPAAIAGLFSGGSEDKKPKIELPAPDLSPSGKLGLNPKKEAKELTGPISESFKEGIFETNEELKETVGDTKTWSFVDDIIPGILDALSGIINWLSKIVDVVIDAITGKNPISNQVEKAYGKESPSLRRSLTKIGESLKSFFLETIPKFIGVAIGTILTEAPKWFGKLFEGISSTAKAEEEKAADGFTGGGVARDIDSGEAIINVLSGFFTKIKDVFDGLGGGDTLGKIGMIVAMTLLLVQIKKLFSLADEISEFGYTVKWVALTIAMVALTSVASTIGELAKSDDPEKAKRAEHFIDTLKELFSSIVEITKWFSIGKIASAVGDVADVFSKGGDIKLISNDLESMFGLGSFFNSFFSLTGIGAGAYVGGTLLSGAIDTTIGTITEAMTDLTSGIEDVVSIVEPFTNKLEGMNSKLSTAIDSVVKIKDLFIAFYNVFDEVYKDLSKYQEKHEENIDEETAAWNAYKDANLLTESSIAKQAFLDSLTKRIDMFNSVSLFLNNIANSLDKIKDIPDIEARFGDLMKPFTSGSFTEFLKALLSSLKDALKEIKLDARSVGITPELYSTEITTIATTMNILADALSVFSNGISGLNEDSVNGLDKTLDVFNKLGESLGGANFDPTFWQKTFLGSDSLSHIGSQIKLFGGHMEKFYTSIVNLPGFKENEVDETKRKIDGVVYLAQSMAVAMQYMQTFGTTSDFFAELGANLVPFGGAVGEFFNAIDTALSSEGKEFSKERSETLLNAVNSASMMLNAIKGLHDMLSFKSTTDMNKEVRKILDAFAGENGVDNATRMATLVQTFDEEFLKRLSGGGDLTTEYTEIGKKLATSLATGIQSAFDEDPNLTIKVKIEPVINGDQYPFNGSFTAYTPGVSINTRDLANQVSDANKDTTPGVSKVVLSDEDLKAITEAISVGPRGAVSAQDLINAFASTKIWVDKERLVGAITPAIDEALGKRIVLLNFQTTT